MFGESVFALIPDHEVRAAKVTNRWISGCVKTTPQVTRFRDGKVDYKIQKERTLYLVLRLRGETEHDTNDKVTTKIQTDFHTKHMKLYT